MYTSELGGRIQHSFQPILLAKMVLLFKLAILFVAYSDHISVAPLPVPTRASSSVARLVFTLS